MRTFAQKPEAARQTTPAKSTAPSRTHFGRSLAGTRSGLHLQRSAGNQAAQLASRPHAEEPKPVLSDAASFRFGHDFSRIPVRPPGAGVTRTKLSLNQPGDEYEREADRVSEEVVRAPEPRLGRECACGGGCANCRPEQTGRGLERLQLKRGGEGEPGRAEAPPLVRDVLRSPGQPLDPATRSFMEPRFGQDLSGVRVHADARAAESARAVGALAYTFGSDVVFEAGRYAPHTGEGRGLLAHELTHVMQQGRGADTIRRKVTTQYETIEDRLTYGVFDWAITDQNSVDVLNVLAPLSDRDLADTVAAMDRDGLLDRLMENISEEDQSVFAVLIGRINRHRSVSHTADWIVEQLSRGFWDWAITDDDAKRAFMVLRGLESQELRSVVAKMVNAGVYDRLREELPTEEIAHFAAFMDRLDRIRDEFEMLVGEQVGFFRSQKDEEGKPVDAGLVISKRVKDTGYGGATSTWKDLSDKDKQSWRQRAAEAIKKVKASVVGTDLEPILSRGQLVFIPEEAEKLNAYAYVSGVNKLFFGRGWVRDAEKNPINVWQSIAHELGGHEEFGDTWSWEIMNAALKRLTPDERAKATSGSNSVYSAYGYLETELYAELRELPHRIAGSGGDKPENDVPSQLRKIKEAFGEKVALQIVIRLYYRVVLDPRVSDEAKSLLYQAVQDVFSLFPLADSPLP